MHEENTTAPDFCLPAAVWADLLADRLADTDRALVTALREAESYRACYLHALKALSDARQAHEKSRGTIRVDAVDLVLAAAGVFTDATLDELRDGVQTIARDYLVAQADAARFRARAFAAEAALKALKNKRGEVAA